MLGTHGAAVVDIICCLIMNDSSHLKGFVSGVCITFRCLCVPWVFTPVSRFLSRSNNGQVIQLFDNSNVAVVPNTSCYTMIPLSLHEDPVKDCQQIWFIFCLSSNCHLGSVSAFAQIMTCSWKENLCLGLQKSHLTHYITVTRSTSQAELINGLMG